MAIRLERAEGPPARSDGACGPESTHAVALLDDLRERRGP